MPRTPSSAIASIAASLLLVSAYVVMPRASPAMMPARAASSSSSALSVALERVSTRIQPKKSSPSSTPPRYAVRSRCVCVFTNPGVITTSPRSTVGTVGASRSGPT